MSNKAAWLYAAQWGSFMRSGDPGACMYGFDESFLVDSEQHRAECLAQVDANIADVAAVPAGYDPDELEKLAELRRKLTEARLESDSNASKLDVFTAAYVAAALWSSTDESDECGGEPMDSNYGVEDIAPQTLDEMREDCAAFQRDNAAELERAARVKPGYDLSQAGHDFWLTRNRHGAGFWDRGIGSAGEILTKAAHAWGSVDLYIGDDGKVHA